MYKEVAVDGMCQQKEMQPDPKDLRIAEFKNGIRKAQERAQVAENKFKLVQQENEKLQVELISIQTTLRNMSQFEDITRTQ